mmetsp:Transcript_10612/g.21931  ORF Transcript_10612/g.21931 Transcript_10612/m.21931 type:complete len:297 (-) Transcript_10612:241-1131(-)
MLFSAVLRAGCAARLPLSLASGGSQAFTFAAAAANHSLASHAGFAFSGHASDERRQQQQQPFRAYSTPTTTQRGLAGLSLQQGGGAPSTDDMVAHAVESGAAPTTFALKHPTERISYDKSGGHDQLKGDPSKRAFTYLVLTGGRFIYAAGLRLLVLKFILSMQASKDVLALASLEVELDNIEEGSTVTMKWRGKPVFIKHRTADEIALANSVSTGELRDPQADSDRCIEPKWLVLIGVCTHLGCVPLADAGDYNGWFCPCHGSHYDVSGRIRKGPAPYNMEVPEYKFLEDTKLLIG